MSKEGVKWNIFELLETTLPNRLRGKLFKKHGSSPRFFYPTIGLITYLKSVQEAIINIDVWGNMLKKSLTSL